MSSIFRDDGGGIVLATDPTPWLQGLTGEILEVSSGSYGLGDGAGGERVNESYSGGCATGDLVSCKVTKDYDGFCNEIKEICEEATFDIHWEYNTCQACHHIEIWRHVWSSSACAGTYTKQVDNLGCDSETSCSKGLYNGCWHQAALDYVDASGVTVYYCYRVQVRKDSGDVLDDTVNCSANFKGLDCFECGGPA